MLKQIGRASVLLAFACLFAGGCMLKVTNTHYYGHPVRVTYTPPPDLGPPYEEIPAGGSSAIHQWSTVWSVYVEGYDPWDLAIQDDITLNLEYGKVRNLEWTGYVFVDHGSQPSLLSEVFLDLSAEAGEAVGLLAAELGKAQVKD